MESTARLNPLAALRAQPPDDQELVARFRAGQPAAFDQLVAAHQARVARLVSRLLDGSADVDDVVQEVFLSVLQNLGRFEGRCEFATWLGRIALNKCRSHRRRQGLWRRIWPRLANNAAFRWETIHSVETSEAHEQIRRAVRQLPARYREAIVLRYFEEMSAGEIGEVLGISPGAVDVRLTRARDRLREFLGAGFEEGT